MMQPDKHIFLDAHASQLLTFSLSQVQDDITVMTSSGWCHLESAMEIFYCEKEKKKVTDESWAVKM